ncbi:MAG: RNA 2',3'-cyclic phosphodiesterase [Chloroflexi bacterium]|nr:RNA 2',3'-cyclic phosphodiesterase [Chloroflexota bacterium]
MADSLFRLFVACELSGEVRAALAAVQDQLRHAGAGRLRWVRPEGIHVTLKFLGEVEADRVDAICAALGPAVEPFSIRVRPAGLGGFPDASARLRVVWVGLEGDIDALAALAGRVDRALEPLGFPREARPFAAHLTLARVRDEASAEERRRLADLVAGQTPAPLPELLLTRLHLVRSVLQPDGAVYQRLASFPPEA